MSSPALWLPGLCPSPAPEGGAKAQRGEGRVRLETAMRLDVMTKAILNRNDLPFPNSWTYTTTGRGHDAASGEVIISLANPMGSVVWCLAYVIMFFIHRWQMLRRIIVLIAIPIIFSVWAPISAEGGLVERPIPHIFVYDFGIHVKAPFFSLHDFDNPRTLSSLHNSQLPGCCNPLFNGGISQNQRERGNQCCGDSIYPLRGYSSALGWMILWLGCILTALGVLCLLVSGRPARFVIAGLFIVIGGIFDHIGLSMLWN